MIDEHTVTTSSPHDFKTGDIVEWIGIKKGNILIRIFKFIFRIKDKPKRHVITKTSATTFYYEPKKIKRWLDGYRNT